MKEERYYNEIPATVIPEQSPTYYDYIDDLYNDKLTSYKQDPLLIEYRNIVIDIAEDIKRSYLQNDRISEDFKNSSKDYLHEKYSSFSNVALHDLYIKWNIPAGSLNLGKHILGYIRKTNDGSIDMSHFNLTKCNAYYDVFYHDCVTYYKGDAYREANKCNPTDQEVDDDILGFFLAVGAAALVLIFIILFQILFQ